MRNRSVEETTNGGRERRFRRPVRSLFLLYALALALVALPACSALPSEEPPVADSTLVDVLIELHLAKARAETQPGEAPDLREAVLTRYGLSEARFNAAMDYYAEHPEEYLDLYDTVLDRFGEERAALNATPYDTLGNGQ